MSFWRSWAASLLGVSGAAVAVPVGLVLTVVVAAAVSGGGGFGGLAQLTSGPEIPGVAGSTSTAAAPLDGGLPALPRSERRRAKRGGGSTPAGRTSTGTAGSPTTTPTTAPTETLTTTPTRPQRPKRRPGRLPTLTTPTPAPATSSQTTPATPADPLRETVKTLQGVVAPLPVVGAPVADAVGTVADLILPPVSGGKGAGTTSSGAAAPPAGP
jgi:hypothetical protein